MRVVVGTAFLVLALVVPVSAFAAPPTAAFTFAPSSPQVGQEVQFNASTSSGTGPLSYSWEFDGDGLFDDAVGVTATRVFASAGQKTVRLRVTGADAPPGVTDHDVPVAAPPNQSPIASFRVFPSAPTAGQVVDLVSVSSDPDGPLILQQWDLDGDGQFDDAAGASAARTFTVGTKVVRLRVFDSSGAQAVQTHTIVVAPRLITATILSPFPVVRLVGRLTRTGARIRSLTVSAPAGASIVVRCGGNRCPLRRISTIAERTGRAIRFRRFERRLRAGVVISVSVTREDTIGKYTRFAIRRRRAPARRDQCLAPGARRPTPCPGS